MPHFKSPDGRVHWLELTDSLELLPEGSELIADEQALALLPKPSAQQILDNKKLSVRAVRKQILDILTGITLAAQLEGDTETTTAYLVVLQGLKDITEDWPTDPTLVDALVMQRYLALRAQCTPQMESAFAQVAS